MARATPIKITVPNAGPVSGLLLKPRGARACYVLAHGAGAGMKHPFLTAIASALAARGIATLRFQFPYLERGSRRPDSPAIAHAAVRAAVAVAAKRCPRLPLFAGGKSYGGRMTSQAQAEAPLASLRGLIFLGFPLHPAGKPSVDRAKHLSAVGVPMLFLQGTRDDLADLKRLRPVTRRLGRGVTLALCRDANHGFHVPARTGRTEADVVRELADATAAWITQILTQRD